MLRIDLKVGEQLKIGDAVVTLEAKSGNVARLAINADRTVTINRVTQSSPAKAAERGINA